MKKITSLFFTLLLLACATSAWAQTFPPTYTICDQMLSIGKIVVTCPPYNASPASSDNSAAFQKAFDKMKAAALTSSGPFYCIVVPGGGGTYVFTSGVVYDTGSAGWSRFCMESLGVATPVLQFNFTGSNTRGINVESTGGSGSNAFYVNNIEFSGGASKPTILFLLGNTSPAQIYIHAKFSDWATYGFYGGDLANFDLKLNCSENLANSVSGAACILVDSLYRGSLEGGWGEFSGGSTTTSDYLNVAGSAGISAVSIRSNHVGGPRRFLTTGAGVAIKNSDVSGNNGETWGIGIYAQGDGTAQGASIANNDFTCHTTGCIYLQALTSAKILGNTVQLPAGVSGIGIGLLSCVDCVYAGNIAAATDSGTYGHYWNGNTNLVTSNNIATGVWTNGSYIDDSGGGGTNIFEAPYGRGTIATLQNQASLAATDVTHQPQGVAYANLGTPANGSTAYCTDCDPALTMATCASSGAKTGAMAYRINGAWICGG